MNEGHQFMSPLERVLAVQAACDQAMSAAQIVTAADALLRYIDELGAPTVVPVSLMAQRLTGAALARGGGTLHADGYSATLAGVRVVLVDAVAVSDFDLNTAHERLRRAGAIVVGRAAIDLLSEGRDVRLLRPRSPDPVVESASRHLVSGAA
jgi:hypothetical protein